MIAPTPDDLPAWFAAARLRAAREAPALSAELDRLAGRLGEPCTVAVVGRVKAGKSSFLNAWLGDDKARVGCTETTATINVFRHGIPADPARPVRVFGRDGSVADRPAAFLDALQGTDPDALRRAEGVDRLEYLLPLEALRGVTLIDTPGVMAGVGEHERRSAEFLRLRASLAERHTAETRRLGESADAVVHLFVAVARAADRDLLDDFHAAGTGGSARNAIGVLAKVDVSPEVLARRDELAARVAGQLRSRLATVVPVSAALWRITCRLRAGSPVGWGEFARGLSRLAGIRWDKLFDAEELFLADLPGVALGVAERERLLGESPWRAFAALAEVTRASDFDPAAADRAAAELSGFGRLREALDRHLLRRGRALRAHRVAAEAKTLVAAAGPGWADLARRLDYARAALAGEHRAHAAAADLEHAAAEFAPDEYAELLDILTGPAPPPADPGGRQRHWRRVAEADRSPARRRAAAAAAERYGALLASRRVTP